MRTDLKVPFGYGTATKTLGELQTWLLQHHHPEYVRRLIAWLDSKNGTVGVGGGWRADGTQPGKPGFAPEGKSFHQNQMFNDGFIGAAAVDLVAADGPDGNNTHDTISWSAVPVQGSKLAMEWGLHCNIDSESWHMQPIEIDGWQRWVNMGSPAPRANYPIPSGKPFISPWPPAPLKPGDKGETVRTLQYWLDDWDKNPGPIDGQYGSKTTEAVKRGQTEVKNSGIADPGPIDGWYGSKTKAAFDKYYQTKGWSL